MTLSIWDIDGTICNDLGIIFDRNQKKNAEIFMENSKVMKKPSDILLKQISKGYEIIYVTGRKNKYLGWFTYNQLRKFKPNQVIFFPDHLKSKYYFDYKIRHILFSILKTRSIKIEIYEDNLGVVDLIKERCFKVKNKKVEIYQISDPNKWEYDLHKNF